MTTTQSTTVTADPELLITVHGVLSDNASLAALRAELERRIKHLMGYSVNYGTISPLALLFEQNRKNVFYALRERLRMAIAHKASPNTKVHVVAHSFGSLALVEALTTWEAKLEADSIILLGSIVPRRQEWDHLVRAKQFGKGPFAFVRPFDGVVPFSFLVGGESSGSRGFSANGRWIASEIWKLGGHTSFMPDDVDDIEKILLRQDVTADRAYTEWRRKRHPIARFLVSLKRFLLS